MKVSSDQRRALQLLADAGQTGCTESIMLAHGFTRDACRMLRNGWATVAPETVRAGWRPIEVARMRITEGGQRALAHRP